MRWNSAYLFYVYLTLVLLAFASSPANAQIYKWVDEDGNVHFGDYPQDEQTSEQLDIEHTNTMEGGYELSQSAIKNKERVAEQQKKDRELAAENASNYKDPCAAGIAEYRRFSQVHEDSRGVPYYVYRDNPDGSPMSQQDHNKMVDAMRVKLEKRGCM